MARQLEVLAVSLLLACLFAFPARAEWSGSDSNNLSMIRNYTSNLQTYLPSISSSTGSISASINSLLNQFTMIDGVTSLLRDIRNYLNISWSGGFASRIVGTLDSIASILGASSYKVDDRNAVYAFDTRYFYTSQESASYEGMIYSGSPAAAFNPSASGRYLAFFLEPGKYVLEANCSNNAYLSSFGFEANSSSPNTSLSGAFEFIGTFDNISKFRAYFTVDSYLTFSNLAIQANTSGYWVNAYLYLVEGSASIVSDSLKPSIDSHGQQLDQGIDQMEDLENTAFGSLDTSIGSLDFSGSALGQVVSGFTFIRAVFSAVYSSSPYISVLINLSCMLGVLALFLRVQPRFSRWEREHRDRTP